MPGATPDKSDISARFDRDGFVVVPDLLTRPEAQAYKAEIAKILDQVLGEERSRGNDRPTFMKSGVFVGLSIRSPIFRQLGQNPRILDVFEAILGPNLLFWSDKVVF